MRLTSTLAAIAIIGLVGRIAAAQNSGPATRLLIGGVELQLGMDQNQALTNLGILYEIRHVDSQPGTWVVTRKGGPPYRFIGSLGFMSERLTFASRSWGPELEEQTATGLAKALHEAVRSVSANGQSRCIVSVNDNQAQWFETVLECGQRRLSIMASSDRDYLSGVSETIGSRR